VKTSKILTDKKLASLTSFISWVVSAQFPDIGTQLNSHFWNYSYATQYTQCIRWCSAFSWPCDIYKHLWHFHAQRIDIDSV